MKRKKGVLIGVVVLLVCLFWPSSEFTSTFSLDDVFPLHANEYSAEAFFVENGFLRYAEAEHMVGIDVSTHQGLIDWEAVAGSGVEFAIIRAGYRGSTVGELYEDEQFVYNLTEAKNAGLQVGVYFFSQALNAQEAREEAEYVCELLNGTDLELPVFYDWEFIGGRVSNPADIPMTECAIAFCNAIMEQGYEAGVYFNQNYGYDYLNLRALQKYTLWLAEYDETPDFAYHFDCLQYTDAGSIDGIEGSVDLDIFFR